MPGRLEIHLGGVGERSSPPSASGRVANRGLAAWGWDFPCLPCCWRRRGVRLSFGERGAMGCHGGVGGGSRRCELQLPEGSAGGGPAAAANQRSSCCPIKGRLRLISPSQCDGGGGGRLERCRGGGTIRRHPPSPRVLPPLGPATSLSRGLRARAAALRGGYDGL